MLNRNTRRAGSRWLATLLLGMAGCRVDSPQGSLRSGHYLAWPNLGRSGGSPQPATIQLAAPPERSS